MRIQYKELESIFKEKLIKYGVADEKAATMAKIFADNTLDGVYSHGILRFPRLIGNIKDGYIDVKAEPTLEFSLPSFERWNGNNGLGVTNAIKMSERAMDLAAKTGVAAVAIKDTNHWMRGGTYGWMCADKGFASIMMTNTTPNMAPWGGKDNRVGNNPLVIAIPRENGEHIVVDMAMSQFSYGKLSTYADRGEMLPIDGGWDNEGNLTKDPMKIAESRRILPTGYWKGSSLSIAIDMLATSLSMGNDTREVGNKPVELGLSQLFIVIDLDKVTDKAWKENMIDSALQYIESSEAIDPKHSVRYPGKGSLMKREEQLQNGIEITEQSLKAIEVL